MAAVSFLSRLAAAVRFTVSLFAIRELLRTVCHRSTSCGLVIRDVRNAPIAIDGVSVQIRTRTRCTNVARSLARSRPYDDDIDNWGTHDFYRTIGDLIRIHTCQHRDAVWRTRTRKDAEESSAIPADPETCNAGDGRDTIQAACTPAASPQSVEHAHRLNLRKGNSCRLALTIASHRVWICCITGRAAHLL